MKIILKTSLLIICPIILIAGFFILFSKEPTAVQTIQATTESEPETETEIIIETEAETVTAEITEIETTEEITEAEEITEPDTTETIEATEAAEIIGIIEIFAGLIPKNVPVLMYHTSSETNPGGLVELYVKPSEFEKQIRYLCQNGFTFCTFDDYKFLNIIEKPIFLTFDDGYKENYTEIFPILQKYNAKITIFLMLNHIKASNITEDMIIEMSGSGLVKFESHTISHPSLAAISSNNTRLTDELQNSKIKIEEITGKPVLALAYPNGEFNGIVKEKTKEFYSFGLRKDLGMHNTDYDPFEIRRIRINRSTDIETFKSLVN